MFPSDGLSGELMGWRSFELFGLRNCYFVYQISETEPVELALHLLSCAMHPDLRSPTAH